MTWTPSGGGDHEGADWIHSSGDPIGGHHTGVGIFKITTVACSIVEGSEFRVDCVEAIIEKEIVGAGKGYACGSVTSGGAGGSVPAQAGYPGSDGAGTGSGTGGGGPGAGGGYGGAGGANSGTLGGVGAAGTSGGTGGDGGDTGPGSAGSVYGNATDLDLDMGSGGGSGGGGGGGGGGYAGAGQWGFSCTGSRGGGHCWINAVRRIEITDTINCDGGFAIGGQGGDGGDSGEGSGGGGGGGAGPGGGSGGGVLLWAPKIDWASSTLLARGVSCAGGFGGVTEAGPWGGTGAGGMGGGGGRIKLFHARPKENYCLEGVAHVYGADTGGAGTFADGDDGTVDAVYNAGVIYQLGGDYKRRSKVRSQLLDEVRNLTRVMYISSGISIYKWKGSSWTLAHTHSPGATFHAVNSKDRRTLWGGIYQVAFNAVCILSKIDEVWDDAYYYENNGSSYGYIGGLWVENDANDLWFTKYITDGVNWGRSVFKNTASKKNLYTTDPSRTYGPCIIDDCIVWIDGKTGAWQSVDDGENWDQRYPGVDGSAQIAADFYNKRFILIYPSGGNTYVYASTAIPLPAVTPWTLIHTITGKVKSPDYANSIWISATGNIYFTVGGGGSNCYLEWFDGSLWHEEATGDTYDWHNCHGFSDSEVYFIRDATTDNLMKWDGVSLSKSTISPSISPTTIWCGYEEV